MEIQIMLNNLKDKKISEYGVKLLEKSRPPSKGGNTKALHLHYLKIDGENYSFRTFGSAQWVYKSDTVSFQYEINGNYKNIIASTLTTIDKNGQPVVRGLRGFSKRLRTADTRLPGSRRECRD